MPSSISSRSRTRRVVAARTSWGFWSGLCVAVDFGDEQFLVSANHVVKAALESMKSPSIHCVVGPVELTLHPTLLEMNEKLDLATIKLRPAEIAALEEANYHVFRPPQWPPPDVEEKDGIVIVGAPRQWRVERSWSELQFGLITIAGVASVVKPHELVCQ